MMGRIVRGGRVRLGIIVFEDITEVGVQRLVSGDTAGSRN